MQIVIQLTFLHCLTVVTVVTKCMHLILHILIGFRPDKVRKFPIVLCFVVFFAQFFEFILLVYLYIFLTIPIGQTSCRRSKTSRAHGLVLECSNSGTVHKPGGLETVTKGRKTKFTTPPSCVYFGCISTYLLFLYVSVNRNSRCLLAFLPPTHVRPSVLLSICPFVRTGDKFSVTFLWHARI